MAKRKPKKTSKFSSGKDTLQIRLISKEEVQLMNEVTGLLQDSESFYIPSYREVAVHCLMAMKDQLYQDNGADVTPKISKICSEKEL
jgi:uncharacterized protein Smg (DUF494 family)